MQVTCKFRLHPLSCGEWSYDVRVGKSTKWMYILCYTAGWLTNVFGRLHHRSLTVSTTMMKDSALSLRADAYFCVTGLQEVFGYIPKTLHFKLTEQNMARKHNKKFKRKQALSATTKKAVGPTTTKGKRNHGHKGGRNGGGK